MKGRKGEAVVTTTIIMAVTITDGAADERDGVSRSFC